MSFASPPQYLAIGHICADLQPDGSTRLGGSALFAACTAHRLGLRVAIVTACAPDLDLSSLPAAIQIVRQPAPYTTIFENRYDATGRVQRLHAHAPPVDLHQMPPTWRQAPIVHLAPIMQEVPHTINGMADTLVGATPQGWLRVVQPNNVVVTEPARLLDLPWSPAHVAVLSEEDVQGDEALVGQLAQRLDLAVLTRAERGATVWQHGASTDVPAFAADVVDPTGAGDVFAAAFFAALHEGRTPVEAARWACAAAAFAIEGPGTTTLPTREQVEQRAASGKIKTLKR
jgi:sugar/nucleoside kinase (ribokinase family)